ncbi:MAG TPA: hypothetical protein VE843_12960 [Ktedonobacteraceae bacterium]|nr:hypothetical protein [Ktedonobacteraceae bacterium]
MSQEIFINNLANILVSLAFVAAILVVVICYLYLRKNQYYLTELMGKGQWEFSKSWATNITILGSLFCTIIAQDTDDALKYAGLSVFFGVLVVVSPLVYNATSQPHTKHNAAGDAEIQYLSPLWAFLISAALTLWAVLGQLATVITLLTTVALKTSLSYSVTSLLLICMVLVTALVVIYAFKTIVWTVREQVSPEAKQYRRKALYDSIWKNARTIAEKINIYELHPEHPAVAML